MATVLNDALSSLTAAADFPGTVADDDELIGLICIYSRFLRDALFSVLESLAGALT